MQIYHYACENTHGNPNDTYTTNFKQEYLAGEIFKNANTSLSLSGHMKTLVTGAINPSDRSWVSLACILRHFWLPLQLFCKTMEKQTEVLQGLFLASGPAVLPNCHYAYENVTSTKRRR